MVKLSDLSPTDSLLFSVGDDFGPDDVFLDAQMDWNGNCFSVDTFKLCLDEFRDDFKGCNVHVYVGEYKKIKFDAVDMVSTYLGFLINTLKKRGDDWIDINDLRDFISDEDMNVLDYVLDIIEKRLGDQLVTVERGEEVEIDL